MYRAAPCPMVIGGTSLPSDPLMTIPATGLSYPAKSSRYKINPESWVQKVSISFVSLTIPHSISYTVYNDVYQAIWGHAESTEGCHLVQGESYGWEVLIYDSSWTDTEIETGPRTGDSGVDSSYSMSPTSSSTSTLRLMARHMS